MILCSHRERGGCSDFVLMKSFNSNMDSQGKWPKCMCRFSSGSPLLEDWKGIFPWLNGLKTGYSDGIYCDGKQTLMII